MDDANIPIGARRNRPRPQRAQPNPANDPARREPARNDAHHQQQEFAGIAYQILKDWRLIVDLLGPIVEQQEAICWAIVLARLAEAAYNIWIGQPSLYLRISIDDLVKKIKKEDGEKEITTLKRCLKVISSTGIKKVPSTSHANPHRVKSIKWEFDTNEAADRNFLATKLELSPVGIIIDIDDEFDALREGFYRIRAVPAPDGKPVRHALMVLARGRTINGQEFFIVQNSWKKTWGVNGYGRLVIDDGMTCEAFYPCGL